MSTNQVLFIASQARRFLLRRSSAWIATAAVFARCTAWLVDPLRSMASLRKIPGTEVYVMDYYADYRSETLREEGMNPGAIEDSLIAMYFPPGVSNFFQSIKRFFVPAGVNEFSPHADACSTVTLKSQDGKAVYFGRNFDWPHDAVLVLRMHDRRRKRQLNSIAVLDLHYLNLDRPDVHKLNFIRRLPLLFAPYFVIDGMNEHGLAISLLRVPQSSGPKRDKNKPDMMYPTLARVILDHAQTTEQAVQMFHDYNIYFPYTAIHFMIADEAGDSKIVEFIGGRIRVTNQTGLWQLCTNDLVWGKTDTQLDLSCPRYRIGSSLASEYTQSVPLKESHAIDVTKSMATKGYTMWSSIYELRNRTLALFYKTQPELAYRETISPTDSSLNHRRGPFWKHVAF